MRYCFYHTDLGQNAVFHNFAKQIALIQYSGRSKHAWAVLAKPLRKIPKSHIRPAGSHFCSASCSECLNEHTRVKLQHNKEIIIIFFLFNGFIDLLSLKAFDTRGILSTPASDVH